MKQRVFTYQRGADYKVVLILNEDTSLTFDIMEVPPKTPDQIVDQFLEEAETKVISVLEKEYATKHSV